MTANQPVDRRADKIVQLERELLRPEVRFQPDRVKALLHPAFQEFGASGAVWTAQAIAEHLVSHEESTGDPLQIEEPTVTDLGPDAILLTYQATSPHQHSLRSSVWVRREGDWKMLFHQGTHRASDPASG